jgi:hypothetical protein
MRRYKTSICEVPILLLQEICEVEANFTIFYKAEQVKLWVFGLRYWKLSSKI